MKKKLLVMLCALVMLVTCIPGALAARTPVTRPGFFVAAPKGNMNGEWENYLVKNNENLKLYLTNSYAYLEDGTNSVWNLLFDTTNKLSARSNQSWLTVKNVGNTLVFNWEANPATSYRTATVTVTASEYKATLNLTQFGKHAIKSAKRNKDTVTIKFMKGKAPAHFLSITESKVEQDSGWGTINISRTVYSGACKKSSYTFKVRKGYHYSVYYGPAIKNEWGYNYSSTCGVNFDVEQVTGSENYNPWNN